MLRITRALAFALAAVCALIGLSGAAHPAEAMTSAASAFQGFDRCGSQSTGTMQGWWSNTNYWTVGIYIGGAVAHDQGCDWPTSSWVSAVNGQGWNIAFVWDDLQPSCMSGSTTRHPISTSTSTAYNQGRSSGSAAHSKAHSLGAAGRAVIYLDIEAYATSNSACNASVINYLKGWHDYLYSVNDIDGVYSSAASAPVALLNAQCSKWTGGCVRMMWFAHYDGRNTVWGDRYFGDNQWHDYRRTHQFRGGHSHTFGGVQLTVDDNCLLGWIEAGLGSFTPSSSIDAQANYPSCPNNGTTHQQQ